ncbi:hypothetical protein TNCV_679741 [Trichonephila clavipes]|nr:hypothetical protein TNCV_679741 [Trichonephila clavipes]
MSDVGSQNSSCQGALKRLSFDRSPEHYAVKSCRKRTHFTSVEEVQSKRRDFQNLSPELLPAISARM